MVVQNVRRLDVTVYDTARLQVVQTFQQTIRKLNWPCGRKTSSPQLWQHERMHSTVLQNFTHQWLDDVIRVCLDVGFADVLECALPQCWLIVVATVCMFHGSVPVEWTLFGMHKAQHLGFVVQCLDSSLTIGNFECNASFTVSIVERDVHARVLATIDKVHNLEPPRVLLTLVEAVGVAECNVATARPRLAVNFVVLQILAKVVNVSHVSSLAVVATNLQQ